MFFLYLNEKQLSYQQNFTDDLFYYTFIHAVSHETIQAPNHVHVELMNFYNNYDRLISLNLLIYRYLAYKDLFNLNLKRIFSIISFPMRTV